MIFYNCITEQKWTFKILRDENETVNGWLSVISAMYCSVKSRNAMREQFGQQSQMVSVTVNSFSLLYILYLNHPKGKELYQVADSAGIGKNTFTDSGKLTVEDGRLLLALEEFKF